MTEGTGVIIAAVPVALQAGEPLVLTDGQRGLPHMQFYGTEEAQIREALEALIVTRRRVFSAFAEQLSARIEVTADGRKNLEIPYLVTTQTGGDGRGWSSCYDFLPWEDQRNHHGVSLKNQLGEALLRQFTPPSTSEQVGARKKLCVLFALEGSRWRPELAAERCRVLIEAGYLPQEGQVDMMTLAGSRFYKWLAQGLGHLRKPLRSLLMPVELMPERFTIPQFQASMEGVLGETLDKQAFRRNVSNCGLIEEAGGVSDEIFGRPARLFRFKNDVVIARNAQSMPLVLPLADTLTDAETIENLLFSHRRRTKGQDGTSEEN
ncbi:NrtR DNA-binding winged helix domain-containing protein [Acetobacter sp.]|jgi:hypothetical protein|uniref:NrtR DNA-binding winged helix domain-containing protein n=1 Tax=Acetobacter sp. TaxID=440 RepID=UPI0025BEA4C9|nr:hypothetical protein [Acetobacter sp.]MCH4090310.1 hypothetical protein [Acetobacter sp.]MCI1299004.1 hypothetical protein [Acetobacter sp.]MCI1315024.1 hypothetical protein [Acetobacter sp.]